MALVIGDINRLTSSIGAISLCVLALFGPAAASERQKGRVETAPSAFHAPLTAAEKALDAILKLADRETESSWFAVEAPWRDKAKDSLFQGHFSQRLKGAWVNAERKAVQENCHGTYVEGEHCGVDIHPITCSQDSAKMYHYRTARSSSGHAIIEYRWPQAAKTIATFRLVRKGNDWQVDGIACTDYATFNMP